ncbi:hypothetical protein AOLI_G00126620 [Acnodon oligacanthus]
MLLRVQLGEGKIDSEVFEEIAKESPGIFRVTLCSEEPGASQSSSSSVRSDDTFTLNLTVCDPHEEVAIDEASQPKRPCRINCEAKALIEKILTSKPGGERIMQEYEKNKSLTDATRSQMINILAAEMTETHGTSPPPEKCQGDRKEVLQGSKSLKVGGPGHVRQPFISDDVPTEEDVEAAIAVLRYSADEAEAVATEAVVNDADKSAVVFLVFPRFLETPGLIERLQTYV